MLDARWTGEALGRWSDRPPAVLTAIDVRAADRLLRPISLRIRENEILALVFPIAPDIPWLRVLAGIDPPAAGVVSSRISSRVVLTRVGPPLHDALASHPNVVILYGLDGLNASIEREVWDQIAKERAKGITFVVAMCEVEKTGRADRISLAPWEWEPLCAEIERIARCMRALTRRLLDPALAEFTPLAFVSAELLRLNRAVLALLDHAWQISASPQEALVVRELAAKVAGVRIDDRVLELIVAET